MRVCSFPGCDRNGNYHGICQSHDKQKRKGKELTPIRSRLKKECYFHDCDRWASSKGLCGSHARQRNAGKILTTIYREPDKNLSFEEHAMYLLDQRSTLNSSTGCIIWNGNIRKTAGYGLITFKGERWVAHRLSYFLYIDDFETAKYETIHHKCAVKSCINPLHLEAATRRENTAEMFERQAYIKQIKLQKQEIINLNKTIQRLEKELNEYHC